MNLFTKVHCRAYMKKISDGIHICIYDEYETEDRIVNDMFVISGRKRLSETGRIDGSQTILAEDAQGNVIKDLSECDGDGVVKQYFKRIPCEFDGFLVGFTRIKTEGIIGTDWDDHPYTGERGYCYKETTKRPEVGVVYFRNNGKRYVLIEDIECLEDKNES